MPGDIQASRAFQVEMFGGRFVHGDSNAERGVWWVSYPCTPLWTVGQVFLEARRFPDEAMFA